MRLSAGPGPVNVGSILIPAHNEASVLSRLLRECVRASEEKHVEIVVVANGCSDNTANVARQFRDVHVIELEEGSKWRALNSGERRLVSFPRIYIDADVRIAATDIVRLLEVMSQPDSSPLSAPRMQVDLGKSSLLVRLYYSVWERSSYRTDDLVGSGVYALTQAGRSRFEDFPDLIADDLFILRMFDRDERRVVEDASFTISAPRTLRSLLRREVRARRGNLEYAALSGESSGPATRRVAFLVHHLTGPRAIVSMGVYTFVYVYANALARWSRFRGRPVSWNQDVSTRR